ncbi:hypothetical protein ACNHKD_14915 [Methylocystis sp. JAN1]
MSFSSPSFSIVTVGAVASPTIAARPIRGRLAGELLPKRERLPGKRIRVA